MPLRIAQVVMGNSIGITATNGKAAADYTNRPEDEANEHHDAQGLARATREVAGRGLRQNWNEVRCEKFGFHLSDVLPRL